MKYSRNFRWGIGVDAFGVNAHKVSRVYKPGIRCFSNESLGLFHFTIVFKKSRFMVMFPYKKAIGECQG